MTALADARLLPDTNGRRPAVLGAVGLVLLLGVGGGWAATTPIAGAVVSAGELVVRGRPQLVQSLDGGVVRGIEVRNGDRVAAGEVLVSFDPTIARTNLGTAEARLADALALKARLEAEQAGTGAGTGAGAHPGAGPGTGPTGFRYPPLPFPRPDLARQEAAQARILEARAAVLAGGRERLAEALAQIEAELAGIGAERVAKEAQARLVAADLERLRALSAEGLAREGELTEATRAQAQLEGEVARLDADAARARLGRRDAELETLQEERAFRESVETELREAAAEVDELTLAVVTRRAELDRATVRSPADGIVHEMAVVTPGGVVAPGETLLQVMPLDRGFEVEVEVDPRAVDQVRPGQEAEVVMAPLDPRAAPRLRAAVSAVSAGAVEDPRSGQGFYRVTLSVSPAEWARLGPEVALAPGMPVEAYLHTGDRSVLAYLVQPVTANLGRAFREE